MAEDKTTDKKQILLRISPSLWQKLSSWADEDFRSINGQIEYVLTDAIRKKYKTSVVDIPDSASDTKDTNDKK